MKKILVIGCGGSGAKTLAYMMDQLKTMLAEKLPEHYGSGKSWELPKAWQFVLIDSPSTPEKLRSYPMWKKQVDVTFPVVHQTAITLSMKRFRQNWGE